MWKWGSNKPSGSCCCFLAASPSVAILGRADQSLTGSAPRLIYLFRLTNSMVLISNASLTVSFFHCTLVIQNSYDFRHHQYFVCESDNNKTCARRSQSPSFLQAFGKRTQRNLESPARVARSLLWHFKNAKTIYRLFIWSSSKKFHSKVGKKHRSWQGTWVDKSRFWRLQKNEPRCSFVNVK